MKRTLILVGLLFGLIAGVSQAQTRVGVSLSFGDPYVSGHVVIGRPYHPSYRHSHYHRYRYYHRGPIIVVDEPVVVVRRHGHHARRHHRHRD